MATYKNYNDLYTLLEGTAPGAARSSSEIMDVFNDTFAFNPSTVRTGKVLPNGSFDTNASATKLTRGFIRNLTIGGEGQAQIPNIRCRFQFNPQDIEHSLEARRDMYLPILQDPAQLKQPIAGNASFAFELIFDRTMEVNSNVSKSVLTNDEGSNGEVIPDSTSVETVGVFHDLRILYSIIGTGLSKELLEAQMIKAKLDMQSYAQRNYAELNIVVNRDEVTGFPNGSFSAAKTTDETDGETIEDVNSSKLATFLNELNDPDSGSSDNLSFMSNLNVGNSAFLTPQPCRVIFSPMFMVDGFVMNTRVLFTKFSAKMIPIQCKVFLQMQAVYIGFAKRQTFLTAQYEEQANQNTDAQRAAETTLVDVCKILQTNMRSIVVGYSSDVRLLIDEDATLVDYLTSTANNSESDNNHKAYSGLKFQPIWLYGTKDFWYRRPYIIQPNGLKYTADNGYDPSYRLEFNNPANTPNFMPGITVKIVNGTTEKDAIAEKVFEAYKDEGPSIKLNVRSTIYGPFGSQVLGNAFAATKLGAEAEGYPPSKEYPTGVKLLGKYEVSTNISTKSQWEKFAERPHDLLLAANHPDSNFYNSSNRAATPITPLTINELNISVFSNLYTKISNYVSTLTQHTVQQKSNVNNVLQLLYRSPYNSQYENIDPKIDGSKDTLFPVYPYVYNSDIPDSLLELVNEVHDLNSRFFVVVTETNIEVNINSVVNAGSPPKGIASTRVVDILQGSTFGHTVNLQQTFPFTAGLVYSPEGNVVLPPFL